MQRVMTMTAGILLLWSAMAGAQTCLGALPYAQAPMRAGATVGFSSSTQTILGGVSRDFGSIFAGGGGVFETASDLDGSAKGLYVEAGTERALGTEKKLFACPLVSFFKTWGLSPALDSSLSSLLLGIGGSVGYNAVTNGTTRVVAFGIFAYDYQRSSFSDNFFGDRSFSDSFLSLQGGVGLIFNDRMALIPVISIPVSSDSGKATFSVTFSTKIGQR